MFAEPAGGLRGLARVEKVLRDPQGKRRGFGPALSGAGGGRSAGRKARGPEAHRSQVRREPRKGRRPGGLNGSIGRRCTRNLGKRPATVGRRAGFQVAANTRRAGPARAGSLGKSPERVET